MSIDLVAAVHDSMAAIVEPLKTQLDSVEAQVEEREAELSELRKLRTELRNALALLDPTMRAERNEAKAQKNGTGTPKYMARPQDIETLRVWLESETGMQHEEFTYTDLKKADTGVSVARISATLAQLHDHGLIRIVRTIKGGGKVYKRVA